MIGGPAALHAHDIATHRGQPLTAEQWEHHADRMIRAAAAAGIEFVISEVLAPLGDHPTPGRRQFVNGRITNTIAGEGLIEHADAQKSLKPTSNKSLVYRWVGTDKARSNAA